jgi:hypothetical protein
MSGKEETPVEVKKRKHVDVDDPALGSEPLILIPNADSYSESATQFRSCKKGIDGHNQILIIKTKI